MMNEYFFGAFFGVGFVYIVYFIGRMVFKGVLKNLLRKKPSWPIVDGIGTDSLSSIMIQSMEEMKRTQELIKGWELGSLNEREEDTRRRLLGLSSRDMETRKAVEELASRLDSLITKLRARFK